MIENTNDLIYNLDYVVCLPKSYSDLLDGFTFSFGNVILFENKSEDVIKFTKFINENNIKKIIFINYYLEYNTILNNLNSKKEILFVFTHSVSSLSDSTIINEYYGIMDLHGRNIIDKLAFTDKSFYESFRLNNENVFNIQIDLDNKKQFERTTTKSIGILNSAKNPRDSFYNELSAASFLDNYLVKFNNNYIEINNFCKVFNININNIYEETFNNSINLYINFADTSNINILRSMDNHVPIIVGNTNIFDSNEYLKSNLVMKSDDDIDEIKQKIENALINEQKIFSEYNKFRNEYSINSKIGIQQFLQKKEEIIKKEESEILLSVIVPVYNTGKYLRECLISIIDAKIDSMEILVINDGSTDNSEEIILELLEKHPNDIIYIKQENKGLGVVRNLGLEKARGKYIASVDSDDTIEPETFREALPYLKNDVDMVIFDWNTIFSETETFRTPAIEHMLSSHNKYYGILFSSIMASTCNKIFKKELFEKAGFKYVHNKKYEDLSTNIFPFLESRTIKYIPKPFYNYLIRSGSIMRSKINVDMMDILKILDERFNEYYLKRSLIDLMKIKYYTYAWRIEDVIINSIYDLKGEDRKIYMEYFYNNYYSNFIDFLKNDYYKDFVDSLPKEKKEYIVLRNKSITEKKFIKFIEDRKKIEKLHPVEILEFMKK